jgi:hypothetical protein
MPASVTRAPWLSTTQLSRVPLPYRNGTSIPKWQHGDVLEALTIEMLAVGKGDQATMLKTEVDHVQADLPEIERADGPRWRWQDRLSRKRQTEYSRAEST